MKESEINKILSPNKETIDSDPLSKEAIIPEEHLPKIVIWPTEKLTPKEIRGILNKVNRFIDFDETIAENSIAPIPLLRGKPIKEFLSEEPYIIQTWGGEGAIKFFTEHFPDFPKPLLILVPPAFLNKDSSGNVFGYGKNLHALKITGKTIIDNEPKERIYAPGCAIIHPDLK